MTEITSRAPVSALQEYLMKKGDVPPTYEFSEITEDGLKMFECMVSAGDAVAMGQGRSKREAKHEAANNMLREFQETDNNIRFNPQAHMPAVDAVSELRYICLQRNYPFPDFEIVHEIAPPNPEFTYRCNVASILRYGTSTTKKWARQLAAQAIIDIVQTIPVMDGLQELIAMQEEDNRSKFKIYKEAVESDIKDHPGILLSDRHNYFKNMSDEKKQKALTILNNDQPLYEYISPKDRIDQVLKALEITYKTSFLPSNNGGSKLFIELICGIDVVFLGDPDKIYDEMADYFKVMLV